MRPARGSARRDLPLVVADGELDTFNAPALDTLLRILHAEHAWVHVDLAGISFAGVSVLVTLRRAADVRVVATSRSIDRLFEISSLIPTRRPARTYPRHPVPTRGQTRRRVTASSRAPERRSTRHERCCAMISLHTVFPEAVGSHPHARLAASTARSPNPPSRSARAEIRGAAAESSLTSTQMWS